VLLGRVPRFRSLSADPAR
jgi:hypothetical protein